MLRALMDAGDLVERYGAQAPEGVAADDRALVLPSRSPRI